MESISKLTYSIIGLVVIVLIIATTIIPVIGAIQNDVTVKENNTGFNYSVATGTVTVTIEINTGVITVNGVQTSYPTYSIFGFTEAMQINTSGATATTMSAWYYDDGQSAFSEVAITKAVWAAGTITLTKSDTTTVTIADQSEFYYISSDGKFAMFFNANASANYTAYFDKASTMTVICRMSASPSLMGVLIFENGEYTNNLYVAGTKATTYTLNSEVEETDLGYKIANLTITATNGVDSQTTGGHQTFVIVPKEYTVVDSASPIFILLGIIPIVMLVIPIMLAVGMISTRRD